MATTFHDYNGNQGTGTGNTDYDFTFPTFKQEEVKVEVDGSVKTISVDYSVPTYSAETGGKIRFLQNKPTLSTQKVRVYRETDVDAAKATFTAGSSLKANELNTNITLLLRSTQDRTNAKNVQEHDLNDRVVTTDKIRDLNVTRSKLALDAIDGTLIADDAIDSEHIAADALDSEHYAPSSVDTTAIANNAVTMDKLNSGALPTDITINTDNIVNGSIVNADVNSVAAIAGTKISPNFGSQVVTTTGNIVVGGTVDGRDVALDGTKLDSIENGATADQTAAEIRTLVESASDSNVFTDNDHTKLDGIEANATADQTGAEIKTLYEANANTNEYSDSEQSKLAGIETAATADQTASEIKTLLQSDKLTLSEIDTSSTDSRYFTETELTTGGALDGRYYTETETEAKFLRQDSSETIASGVSWSNSDAFVATTAAINARIIDLIDEVGGFTAIANQTSFPTTNPQGATGQSAILSIAATTATLTPSGTTVTITDGAGSGNDVTITGVTTTIPTGFGFLVESTATTHEYSFHRLVPIATQVNTVAQNITNIVNAGANVADINNFADIYIISASEPSQRNDGTSLQEGDLWYDSSNDNLQVYTGSAFSIITPNQSVLDDVAIVSGAITYSEDLGLITDAVSTGSSNGSLDIVADAIEDEITFTVTAATGKFIIDGVDKPALTLYKGWTYTFDVSDASNANHPLRFSSGGSAYNTGVTVTGTQGQAGAKVQLVVPESQPTSFAYYCTAHSGMGNTITVKDDPIKTVSDNITGILAAATNNTNVTAVAGNATNINTVAGKATEIGRLGTADAVADMNTLGTSAIVSDMDTLADISSNITSVANNASNINSAVSNASNINSAVSNASNINTVAGNNTNINTVAGISSDVTTVAGNNSNVTAVAGNNSNITSVAGNASNINSAVSNASNINTVAGSISNVNTVGGSISNVNTVASNINNVNSFAGTYQIASSAPSTDGAGNALAAGDLYFDTTANELRVHNGSTFQGGVTATGNLAGLGANTFTGDQTVNANIIVSGTVDGVDIANRDTLFDGLTSSSGVLKNGVTATTQGQSSNNAKVATTAFVHTAVANLVDSAPGTLDTLNELAAALGDDANYATTTANSIATKAPLASPTFTGTVTAGTIDGTNLTLDFGTL